MRKVSSFINDINSFLQTHPEITLRKLTAKSLDIYILFIQQVTDRDMLSDNIIKPLLQYANDNITLTVEIISNSVIYMDDIVLDYDEAKIMEHLLNGKSVILFSGNEQFIVANTSKYEKRISSTPELEYSLRGPRDSFIENLDSNLSLIRYRIKDPGLKTDKFVIGRRTKTIVAVAYISDIVNLKHVDDIKKRLQSIDTDGVIETGYIQKFISDNSYTIFPQVGILERPDMASANLLEGKIIIMIQGSNFALVTPRRLVEFLDAPDDHYENVYTSIFAKYLRFISIMLTISASPLYVAVVGFHSDILPPSYIMALATSRSTTPFDAKSEAVIMEIVGEILREASIRLPSRIGPAIGIVGTIVIGQAAVFAGLVSPLMVIVVALSTMSSFVASDYSIMGPARLFKFLLLFITSIFGIFGFVMGFNIIIIMAVSLTSLGEPYTSPVAPFQFNDLKNYILSDISIVKKRPKDTNDNTR